MSFRSPEGLLLPSETCTLPTPERVSETMMSLHNRFFQAAEQPMLAEGNLHSASHATWSIEQDDVKVGAYQDGRFIEFPSLDSLRGGEHFYVFMKVAEDRDVAYDAWFTEGELSLAESRDYSSPNTLNAEQIENGRQQLLAFLDGEREADTITIWRDVDVITSDGASARAGERVTTHRDGRIDAEATLEIDRSNLISFEATMTNGDEATTVKYRDIRDYDGFFGIDADWYNDRFPRRQTRTHADMPRLPERRAHDEAIDQTRSILTTGRLNEVRQHLEDTCAQLEGYHQRYADEFLQGK
jgi:hypothetical protein